MASRRKRPHIASFAPPEPTQGVWRDEKHASTIHVGSLRVSVHGWILEPGWFVSCHRLNVERYKLEAAEDLESAKRLGLAAIMVFALNQCTELNDVVTKIRRLLA